MTFRPYRQIGGDLYGPDGFIPPDTVQAVMIDIEARAESAAAGGEIEQTAFLAKSRDSLMLACAEVSAWWRASGGLPVRRVGR